MTGCLSVVATPIGCLEDITLRALRILGEADGILAEDTRRTRTLCTKHAIKTPLRSFHEHTDARKLDAIVDELVAGAHFALVSDAGTPAVSDPGAHLVARAAAAGVSVEAIPGPSAVSAALSIAGWAARRFTFEGFLPKSGTERAAALDRMAVSPFPSVVFESPFRIDLTLEDLARRMGDDRQLVLCRELTKVHEQTLRGTVAEVRSQLPSPTKGELTILIDGSSGPIVDEDVDVRSRVRAWTRDGLSTKDMTRRLVEEAGWKRNRAYRAILEALEEDG